MYIHLQYDNGDPSVVNNRLIFSSYKVTKDETNILTSSKMYF